MEIIGYVFCLICDILILGGYMLILILVSILPVFILGSYIYKKDKNREPIKLLVKLFIGGIISAFLTLRLSSIAVGIFPLLGSETSELNLFELFIYVFIGIALIEEFCKWIMVYSISYMDKHFDEMYDIIVYSVFVSLGFACFENLLYVIPGGLSVGIKRAILSVPGHAWYGVFMGYYLALAKASSINKRNDLKKKNIIYSILVPTIMHGIYDYCVFSGMDILVLVFYVFVIILYIIAIKKVKQLSSVSRTLK